MIDTPKPLFESVITVVTPAALRTLAEVGVDGKDLLDRHFCGDWGEVDPDDAGANDQALESGGRILSAYVLGSGVRVWILTEGSGANGKRSATTILLPTEY